jgi:hypothetical protein
MPIPPASDRLVVGLLLFPDMTQLDLTAPMLAKRLATTQRAAKALGLG